MILKPTSVIANQAHALGFALVGWCTAVATGRGAYIKNWIAQGQHGEMAYLANHLDVRLDPQNLLPHAQTVICVADFYPPTPGPAPAPAPEVTVPDVLDGDVPHTRPPVGRIARYAWGDDYHKTIKKRLFRLADCLREHWPEEQYKVAVDTAPLLEREHAQQAGLGWMGKHTLLIHPDLGSWMLLGQIVTTLVIEENNTSEKTNGGKNTLAMLPMTDHCGSCTRCIDACPTQCIDPAGYRMQADRCISYLTLEHRSLISEDLQVMMGDWIAGCDVCQQVCPYNQRAEKRAAGDCEKSDADAQTAFHPSYTPRPPSPAIDLLALLDWDQATRQKQFAKSALKRVKLDQLKRNALIAAGNFFRQQTDHVKHTSLLRDRIQQLADAEEEPDLVRQTARQVLERISCGR